MDDKIHLIPSPIITGAIHTVAFLIKNFNILRIVVTLTYSFFKKKLGYELAILQILLALFPSIHFTLRMKQNMY